MNKSDDISKKVENSLASAQHSAEKGNWAYMKCSIDDALESAKTAGLDLTLRIKKIELTYYNLAINFTLSEAEKAINSGKTDEANRYITQAENYGKYAGIDISARISELKSQRLQ